MNEVDWGVKVQPSNQTLKRSLDQLSPFLICSWHFSDHFLMNIKLNEVFWKKKKEEEKKKRKTLKNSD